MKAIFELLNRLMTWIEEYQVRRKSEALQHEQDKIDDDPVDWFSDHFSGGMLNNDNASEASKTNTEQHNQGE